MTSASVDDDACGAALAADLGVDASFVRCHADDDVTVDVGNATRRAASLVYAISGMTSFPAFAAAVARADPNANPNANATATATSFPRVRALGGGAAPVAQFSRHHAFLTYAVETSNRDAADAMIHALESDAARDALAALVDAPRRACVIRNVAYKLPPIEEAAWPPLRPPSLAARLDRAPGRDARGVVHGGRPPRGVGRGRRATPRETPTGLDARGEVARRASDARGCAPRRRARRVRRRLAEVDVPRETMDLMGLEQLCAALAVDVGAHAADAKCVVDDDGHDSRSHSSRARSGGDGAARARRAGTLRAVARASVGRGNASDCRTNRRRRYDRFLRAARRGTCVYA